MENNPISLGSWNLLKPHFFPSKGPLSFSSDCKFIWCWISIKNKTLMSGSQECHFLCCQTATDKIFSWFIEIIPTRALEGKRQCFTGETNGFLSLTLLSVCAKGLLKPSWLHSYQSPSFQRNAFALVSCWKLLSDAGRLRSQIPATEDLPRGFPTMGFWPWPEVINHLGASLLSKGTGRKSQIATP